MVRTIILFLTFLGIVNVVAVEKRTLQEVAYGEAWIKLLHYQRGFSHKFESML